MRKVVSYTVKFTAIINLPDNPTNEDIKDAISDINIPEDHSDNGSHYVENSFEVDLDEEGNYLLTPCCD